MNEQFTPELLASARTAESPEALLTLAAENGVTLTPEEAQAYFDQFHQTGELTDEELEQASGGGYDRIYCSICGALKASLMHVHLPDKCPNKECPSNKLQDNLNQNDYVVQTPSLPPL